MIEYRCRGQCRHCVTFVGSYQILALHIPRLVSGNDTKTVRQTDLHHRLCIALQDYTPTVVASKSLTPGSSRGHLQSDPQGVTMRSFRARYHRAPTDMSLWNSLLTRRESKIEKDVRLRLAVLRAQTRMTLFLSHATFTSRPPHF